LLLFLTIIHILKLKMLNI